MVIQMGEECSGVQMAAKTACGGYNGYAALQQLICHEFDKLGALADDILIHGFIKAHGDGFHFTNAHSAVGEESLKHGDQLHHAVAEGLIPYADAAATGKAQLSGGEVYYVKAIRKGAGDLTYGHVGAGCLTGLYEVEIILKKACVQHCHDVIVTGQFCGGAAVFKGEGLAADKVGACLEAQEGHVALVALNGGLELIQVHVALKEVFACGIDALIAYQLLNPAAALGNVGLGGGKVEVHCNHVAGLYECFCDDMLCGSALMGGQEEFHAEYFLKLCVQAVEGFAAGVCVVCHHHGGKLIVAHGVYAAVGEHIHEYVTVLKQEGIAAGLLYCLKALLHRGQVKLLYDAYLVHLEGYVFAAEEFYLGHFECPPKI